MPLENYGYDVERGMRVQARVEGETPIVWALTLIAAVIPGVLLLLGVRWAADRFVPGYGTAAAITLGLATIVMIFAAEFFSHVISAALGFAAFCVLMKERDGPMRRSMVFGAGPAGRARGHLRVPDRSGRRRPVRLRPRPPA